MQQLLAEHSLSLHSNVAEHSNIGWLHLQLQVVILTIEYVYIIIATKKFIMIVIIITIVNILDFM